MRYFITADVHGSFNTWMTIRELMAPGDGLVTANDLAPVWRVMASSVARTSWIDTAARSASA
ncbi:MAG: hypothetical protein MI892_21990, partial [Desulfobacterales bacterium]|nr:hypothetical protein [Desulfobacterales bacterium]